MRLNHNTPDAQCYLPTPEEIARECALLRASRPARYAALRKPGEKGAIREISVEAVRIAAKMEGEG